MSLVRIIDVVCDGCWETLDECAAYGDAARRSAREGGWRTNLPGGRDLCPDCR